MLSDGAVTWPVLVSATDHTRYEVSETFHADTRTEVTYFVRKKFYSAYETIVRAQRERKEVACKQVLTPDLISKRRIVENCSHAQVLCLDYGLDQEP